MTVLWHALFAFLVGFGNCGALTSMDSAKHFLFFAVLCVALLLAEIYFLGWWSVLSWALGMALGAKIAFDSRRRDIL